MAKKQHVSISDIQYLARLAKLPISEERQKILVDQVETVYDYVETLEKVDTSDTLETNQVTGLTNVWREDEVDSERMLSQDEALKNAPATHKGFFTVPAILE